MTTVAIIIIAVACAAPVLAAGWIFTARENRWLRKRRISFEVWEFDKLNAIDKKLPTPLYGVPYDPALRNPPFL